MDSTWQPSLLNQPTKLVIEFTMSGINKEVEDSMSLLPQLQGGGHYEGQISSASDVSSCECRGGHTTRTHTPAGQSRVVALQSHS